MEMYKCIHAPIPGLSSSSLLKQQEKMGTMRGAQRRGRFLYKVLLQTAVNMKKKTEEVKIRRAQQKSAKPDPQMQKIFIPFK